MLQVGEGVMAVPISEICSLRSTPVGTVTPVVPLIISGLIPGLRESMHGIIQIPYLVSTADPGTRNRFWEGVSRMSSVPLALITRTHIWSIMAATSA
jgi:hypothetical protein